MNNFNRKLALKITGIVSTMWCAYAFMIIALISLPATLTIAKVVPANFFPKFLVSVGLIALVAWVAQTFIQLVLLSVIMVGQQIQAEQTINHVSKKTDELKTHVTKVHKGGK